MSGEPLPRGPGVRLLELEPDLGRELSAEERGLVGGLYVPLVAVVGGDVDIDALLAERRAFAAVIADGMLVHRMAIGEQPALRLLGRGDILTPTGSPRSALLTVSSHRSAGTTSLALLDDRVLLTARQFPRLFTAVQTRIGEQYQRLATQLAICQLPRVEDRLLSLMWLLAETWGRVTPSGTVLPLTLTHDALGELIGARRPTVSLALKELTARGALLRQDGGWLLLLPPPSAGAAPLPAADPGVTVPSHDAWRAAEPRGHPAATPEGIDGAQFSTAVARLRAHHARSSKEIADQLETARRTRAASLRLREGIALRRRQAAASRRPAP